MKFKILPLLLALSLLTIPLQAKDIEIGKIVHLESDVALCESIKDGDTLTIKSMGGHVQTSYNMAKCIREKDVTIKVKYAASAATTLVLSAQKICLYKKARLGFHSPTFKHQEESIDILRAFYLKYGRLLYSWGYSAEKTYAVIGVEMLTPPNRLTLMPIKDIKKLIGNRYIGECSETH